MSGTFTAPKTQEELDAIIKSAVDAAVAPYVEFKATAEALATENADLKQQVEASVGEISALKTSNEDLQKQVSAREELDALEAVKKELVKDSHVPVSALRGANEDELKAHFAELERIIPKPAGPVVPGVEGKPGNVEQDEGRTFVKNLFGSSESSN